MKEKLTITIDKKILQKFKTICNEEGFKMSTKIEKLVEKFIESR